MRFLNDILGKSNVDRLICMVTVTSLNVFLTLVIIEPQTV